MSTTPEELLESVSKIRRYTAIRDGKRVIVKKKQYATECKDGYKRVDGKCVKMSQSEKVSRSKASKKASRKSSTKRNRSKSVRRRSSLKIK